ncbi:MAG TPA: hypothetical protein VL769_08355 [Acidimicrobiia bacterium]|nr:hypothetical protein [Acidimicrobiia bacterium]
MASEAPRVAVSTHLRQRLRLRRPRWSVPAFAEWSVYGLTIVLVLGPGLLHAGTRLVGRSDDGRYYAWLGWAMGRLIANGHIVPLRIPNVIAPFGLDLRLVDGYLPSYVSGLYNLVFGPFLSYNLTFLTGAVLNLLAARSLARRLTPYRLVHVITAVAFASAPPIALNVQVGLLPLFWAFTLPLLVGDAIDVVTKKRDVRPVRLALLLVGAYLCSVYFVVFGGLAYGLIVGVAALRGRSWRIPMTAVGAAVIALVVLTPFVASRVGFDRSEKQRGADTQLVGDSNLFSADALSIVAQPTRSTVLLPRPTTVDRSLLRLVDPTNTLEWTIFPGLALLVGGGLFVARRDARRIPIVVAAVVMWVFALGPSLKVGGNFVWEHAGKPVSWLPYRLVLAVPALGALRAPFRTGYVLVALLVAATVIGLHRLLVAHPQRAVLLAIGSGVLLATNLLLPLPTDTFGVSGAEKRALQAVAGLAGRGDTLMSVPADCDPAFVSLQALHHAPVVGCAGSFAANPWRSELAYVHSPAFTKLRCDRKSYGRITTTGRESTAFDAADVTRLRERFGVRFVVVDREALGRVDCTSAAGALSTLSRYRSLGGDRDLEVLDLSRLRDG